MAVKFHPLPVDLFDEKVRPYIARLNRELRDVFGLEGTLEQTTTSIKRSDATITRRGKERVHITRIIPSILDVIAGTSVSPSALFTTTTPVGVSTGVSTGSSDWAARIDHVHSGLIRNKLVTVDLAVGVSQYMVIPEEVALAADVEISLGSNAEIRVI